MLTPHVSVSEKREHQNNHVRKGTKGQGSHIRHNDTWLSASDI